MSLASFDFFDTAVVRKFATPTDLFLLVEAVLEREGFRVRGFGHERIIAEQRARISSAHEEITLAEIYAELGAAGYEERVLQRGMELEQTLEAECIFANSEVAKEMSSLHASGGRVICVSDTYLSQTLLKDILAGLRIPVSALYTSSDLRMTKHSGSIWRHVLQQEDIAQPKAIRHLGDNLRSDVEMPSRHGICADVCRVSALNRYERYLAECTDSRLYSSMIAGSARVTRLQRTPTSGGQTVSWEIGSAVVAPLVYTYVDWLLRDAAKRGIETLFFLARDGEILLEVAQSITQRQGIPISCKYLHVSRAALPTGVDSSDPVQVINWLVPQGDTTKVEFLLSDSSVSPELRQRLSTILGTPSAFRSVDSDLLLTRFVSAFRADPLLRAQIREFLAVKLQLCREYLRSAGVRSGARIGFVDIGWTGRMASALIRAADVTPVGSEVIYLLSATPGAAKEASSISSFINPESRLHRVPGYRAVVELFCSSASGSTLDYTAIQDQVVPLFGRPGFLQSALWDGGLAREAIRQYVSIVLDHWHFRDPLSYRSDALENVLVDLLTQPSRDEAAVLGSVHITSDGMKGETHPLAEPINRGLVYLMAFGLYRPRQTNVWSQGVARNSLSWDWAAYNCVRRTKDALKRVAGR